MEVRLSRKDLQILDTGGRGKPTERPFEYVPPFDPRTNTDDIVEVLIHDENQNFLERGIVDVDDVIYSSDGIRLKTGVILRKFGYDRGRYVVKYNFLRNLAGSDETVLVDESGNVYDGDFHVMPDGTIMDGESHETSEGIILRLLELKYFIQQISGTRREIRILPQEINDIDYIDKFLSLSNGVRRINLKNNSATFKTDAQGNTLAGDSLAIEMDTNQSIIPQMKGGLIYLNNAFIETERKKPTPEELNTRIEELDSDNVQARFIIISDNGRESWPEDKSLQKIHNFFAPLPDGTQFTTNGLPDRNIGNGAIRFVGGSTIANRPRTGTQRDIRWLNEEFFDKVNYKPEGGGTENPVIVTLRSISERPQNISFLYEWEFFGVDIQVDNQNVSPPITPKIPGTRGGEIFIPSQPNSLTTSGTDLKELTVHIYGEKIQVGVRLKISSKDGLSNEVLYPACIETGRG